MNPLVSVMMPTRGRSVQAAASVRSLLMNADDPSRVEFVFRTDVGDDESRTTLRSLGVAGTTLKGDRYDGYRTLNLLYADCASYATGDWLWIWNDDAKMLTKGWDTALSHVPLKHGVVKFNERDWETDQPEPSIFPIFPRRYYELLGFISLHPCNDGWIHDVIVDHGGFPITFLKHFKVRQPDDGDNKESCAVAEKYRSHHSLEAAKRHFANLLKQDRM